MFRDSDYVEKAQKRTYPQPAPQLQYAAAHSHFDEGRETQQQQRSLPMEIIPPTWDTRFNPEHPDADYAGLVSKQHPNKRHTNDHVSQHSNIKKTDLGLTGQDSFVLPRKRPQDVKYNPITGEPIIESPLIAGPGKITANDQWKTSYQRFSESEPTSRDMLTFERQQELRKVPQQSRHGLLHDGEGKSPRMEGRSYESQRHMLLEMQHAHAREQAVVEKNITGSGGVARGSSLITNLGESLANRLPDFQTSGAQNKPRPKVLYVENFSNNYKKERK